ncbi:hypothetical protein GGR53DRAFT_9616 [Hypoxylon sp. FL1150]|nr:hypothetical protein GGR53DRAFT_9616 [Hypoxylon sp. FL1150]
MTCSCRTASLRLFIQGLTELRLSGSIPTSARWRCQPHYNSAAVSPFSRPYSATATLRLSWQNSKNSAASPKISEQASEAIPQQQWEDATSEQPSDHARPVEVSATDLDQAKRKGTSSSSKPPPIYEMEDLEHTDFGRGEEKEPRPRRARLFQKVEKFGREQEKKKTRKADGRKAADKDADKSWTPPKKKEEWQIQKSALQRKFPTGWSPRKRLSPDALDGIRALHAQFPEDYTTEVLAAKFEVSPENIRRILRARWAPRPEEEEDRQERWFKRGKNIWTQLAALGRKPPRRWRKEGVVRDPVWNEPRGPRTQPPRQRQRQWQRHESE